MKNRHIIIVVFASVIISSNFCMAMQRRITNRGATDGITAPQDTEAFIRQTPFRQKAPHVGHRVPLTTSG